MPFMELEIHQGDGWIAETNNGSVVIYDWNTPDVEELREKIGKKVWMGEHYGTLESVTYVKGFFGRYSAPGYLDCTPWEYSENREELEKSLKETYGTDEEDEEDED